MIQNWVDTIARAMNNPYIKTYMVLGGELPYIGTSVPDIIKDNIQEILERYECVDSHIHIGNDGITDQLYVKIKNADRILEIFLSTLSIEDITLRRMSDE